ncbi:MAG: divergent polysaccharide deacetylase family protein [Holophagaceae bacterium]
MGRSRKGGLSTPALVGWALGVLLLGVGLGVALGQLGCERKAPPRKPAPVRPAPEPPKPRPVEPRTPPPKEAKAPEPVLPRLAIIIDDLGYAEPELVTRLVAQPVPFTVAVLPYQEHTKASAEIAHKAGKEVILHLPMEGREDKDPGPDALLDRLPEAELRARTRKALGDVPFIAGANNHMGSKLTADRPRMRTVLEEFRGRKLFFVDSRTSKDTVAYDVAKEVGLPAASRKVFLDDSKDFEEIRKQWERALNLAKKDGEAIAIGHIYPETVAALERLIPAAKADVRFVKAGELAR